MSAKPTSRTPADSSQLLQNAAPNQAMHSAGLASNCPGKAAASVKVDLGDQKVAVTGSQPKRGGQLKGTSKSGCATGREAIAPTLFPLVLPQDRAASHGTSAASQPPPDASQPPNDAAPRSGKPAPSARADARPPAELTGIARLAASSPLAQEKRSTEYFLLPVRSILNRCDSPRMPFEWTVNPYRGCEFGCKYCYARYTHEYMELDGGDFEKKIFVKQNAGPLFERDLLRRIEPLTSNLEPPEHIAIGTATDPYQPAEREFGVTRAILERIAEREGMSVSITTKSDQVVRDIDLLQRITARSWLTVNLSITTPRPRLCAAPRPPR